MPSTPILENMASLIQTEKFLGVMQAVGFQIGLLDHMPAFAYFVTACLHLESLSCNVSAPQKAQTPARCSRQTPARCSRQAQGKLLESCVMHCWWLCLPTRLRQVTSSCLATSKGYGLSPKAALKRMGRALRVGAVVASLACCRFGAMCLIMSTPAGLTFQFSSAAFWLCLCPLLPRSHHEPRLLHSP